MALTITAIENVLRGRVGGWMDEAEMSKAAGSSDYDDPIGWAIRQAGYTTADPTDPADSDLNNVATADYDKVFDLAEYRMLENIRQNYSKVNYTIGTRGNASEQFEPMLLRIKEAIADKKEQLEEDYGFGSSQTSFNVFAAYPS